MNLAVPPVWPPAPVRGHRFFLSTSLRTASGTRQRRALIALCALGLTLGGGAAHAALPFGPPRFAITTRVFGPVARQASRRPSRLAPVLAPRFGNTVQPVVTPSRTPRTAIVHSPQDISARVGRIARPSSSASGALVATLPDVSGPALVSSMQSNAERLRLSRGTNGVLAVKGAPAFPSARFPAFANSTFGGVQSLPDLLAPAHVPSAPVPFSTRGTATNRVAVTSNVGGGKMIQFQSSAQVGKANGSTSNVSVINGSSKSVPALPPLPMAPDAGQLSANGMKKVIQVPGLSLPPLSQPLPDWMQAASVRVDRLEKGGKQRLAQNPNAPMVRQPIAPVTNSDRLSNRIEVAVSTFVVLLTTTDLQTVAVADPSVADVAVVNSRSVLLNGKGPGVTSLIIVDGKKIRQYSVRVTAAPDKQPDFITAQIGVPGVTVRQLGDALILDGEVGSPEEAQHAAEIAGIYSPKVINQLRVRQAADNSTTTSVAQLSDLLSDYPGVKARIAGDTIILSGEVSDPNQITDAQTVATATGKKVVNLIRLPALSVEQLQQSLGAVNSAPSSLATPGQMTTGAPLSVRELGGQLILEGFLPAQSDIDIALASARRTGLPVVNRLQIRPALSADQLLVSTVAAAIGRPGVIVRGTPKRLVLEGLVNDTNEAVLAEQVARGFAQSVDNLLQTKAPVQVNVDVTIAELNSNDARTLGVQYGTASLTSETVANNPIAGAGGAPIVGADGFPITAKTTTRSVNPAFNQGVALAGNGFLGLGPTGFIDPFRARINALVANGRGRILSAPSTTVLSGRTATFQVGGQVPIPGFSTVGANGSSTSIVFKDYGILLDVVPNALPNGVVTLRIRTEVSQPDFANGITPPGGGGVIPGFQRRSTVTEVTVPPSGVLSLSGLIRSEDTKTETGVPILSKIPIIGALFRSKDFRQNKTELVIFVKPRVLANPLTGDQTAYTNVVAVGENTNVATQLGNPGLIGFDAGGGPVLSSQSGGGAR